MDVACSTLCFTKRPLEQALRTIAEMEFARVDLGVGDAGEHIKPATIVSDVQLVLQQIRQGPTIGFAGITARFSATGDQLFEQVEAISHLAKHLSTPILTVEAADSGSALEEEIDRLSEMARAAAGHGATICVVTKLGTLTESVADAEAICCGVPGIGLTFDPSCFVCRKRPFSEFEPLFQYVRHVHLRDSGESPEEFQLPVGRGQIDYSRIMAALAKVGYRGSLVVAIEDSIPSDFSVEMEVRKLGRVLESLL